MPAVHYYHLDFSLKSFLERLEGDLALSIIMDMARAKQSGYVNIVKRNWLFGSKRQLLACEPRHAKKL
jgi:hypothetical protein